MLDTPENGEVNSPPMIQTVDPKFLAALSAKIKRAEKELSNDGALAKVTAKTRAVWQQYGQALLDARTVLASHKKFGQFLKEHGLDTFASRNHRTDAMWLANLDPDFVSDVVPASIHAPMLIRQWYKKTLMRVVASVKGNAEDTAAADELSPEDRAFFDAVDSSDWDAAVATWKTMTEPVKFRDMPIGDAVAAIMKKIGTYTAPGALADALQEAFANHDWNPTPEAPVEEAPETPAEAPETPEAEAEVPEVPETEEAVSEAPAETEEASEPEADPVPAPRRRRRG